MAGNGIPLVARRLREMLTQKKSMSARTVSEYDGDAAQSVEKEQVGTNFLFNCGVCIFAFIVLFCCC